MMIHTDTTRLIRSSVLLLSVALVAPIGQTVELRGQAPAPPVEEGESVKPVRVLQGRITSDVRLTSDFDWVLRGDVVVAAQGRLVVDPAARVIGDAGSAGTLVIERGGQLIPNGMVEVPVVFPAGQPIPQFGRATVAAGALTGVGSPRSAREGAASRAETASTEAVSDTNTEDMGRAQVASASKRPRPGPRTSQVVGPPNDVPSIDKPVRVLHGRFTSDLLLTSDTYWVLRGAVFVGEPARIVIEPGTRIIGETATAGTLIIERGGQIVADGTADAPIVFTSDQPIGERGRGDWGGLIINGRAPVNLPGGVGIGEGDTGVYGGDDPDDNSGILRYVRVEFAGIEFSPDNELNGIAFQGVGRGTIVEHIQVHFNKDDGIEMFGGTVDVKRVVLTGIADDSMDWTFGWQGRAQFVIAQQRGDDADRGIEADSNANNNDLLPRSKPTIYNLTLIGDPTTDWGPESTVGMTLREGTAGILRNFIVTGFKGSGIAVSNSSTLAQVTNGELSARHGIVFGNGTDLPSSTSTLVAAAAGTINVVDPQLIRPFDQANPDFRPAAGSPAILLSFEPPPNDGFFETAPFRGALSDDPAQDWTLGWTYYTQQ